MIAFIDTEVNPQTKKVADYGAEEQWGQVSFSLWQQNSAAPAES